MKKILMSVFAIAVMAAVAGVGSWALWSDTETSNGNTITAGSLDLEVTVDDQDSTTINVDNVYPSYFKEITGTVSNKGSIDGYLTLELKNLSQTEGGSLIEPEKEVGDTWDEHEDGSGNGELCDEIVVSVNGADLTALKEVEGLLLGKLNAAQTVDYSIKILVNNGAGNEIMTDKCTFDVVTTLSQEAPSIES